MIKLYKCEVQLYTINFSLWLNLKMQGGTIYHQVFTMVKPWEKLSEELSKTFLEPSANSPRQTFVRWQCT